MFEHPWNVNIVMMFSCMYSASPRHYCLYGLSLQPRGSRSSIEQPATACVQKEDSGPPGQASQQRNWAEIGRRSTSILITVYGQCTEYHSHYREQCEQDQYCIASGVI